MANVTFTFEHPFFCNNLDCELTLTVKATYLPFCPGSRDSYGAPIEPDEPAEIIIDEILQATSISRFTGKPRLDLKPTINPELEEELKEAAWEHLDFQNSCDDYDYADMVYYQDY